MRKMSTLALVTQTVGVTRWQHDVWSHLVKRQWCRGVAGNTSAAAEGSSAGLCSMNFVDLWPKEIYGKNVWALTALFYRTGFFIALRYAKAVVYSFRVPWEKLSGYVKRDGENVFLMNSVFVFWKTHVGFRELQQPELSFGAVLR